MLLSKSAFFFFYTLLLYTRYKQNKKLRRSIRTYDADVVLIIGLNRLKYLAFYFVNYRL